jgi:hypothetical protein
MSAYLVGENRSLSVDKFYELDRIIPEIAYNLLQGKSMIFCGAIDTHRILPFGTPEVGGGYMLASVHTIMPDVPPENVLAMVDAAIEFGNHD